MDVHRENTDVRWVGFHPLTFWTFDEIMPCKVGCVRNTTVRNNLIKLNSYLLVVLIEDYKCNKRTFSKDYPIESCV
jgi:hypothetical protein